MPMPTVVKGAPVASRIPPHENRAKPRVVPDENQAESLRRVAPDENQAELLRRVVPDENRGSVAPMQCAIRESGTPRPIRKTIPPSGLTGKNDTPETIPTDFPRKFHRRGQTTNLPRGKMRSKSRPPKANG